MRLHMSAVLIDDGIKEALLAEIGKTLSDGFKEYDAQHPIEYVVRRKRASTVYVLSGYGDSEDGGEENLRCGVVEHVIRQGPTKDDVLKELMIQISVPDERPKYLMTLAKGLFFHLSNLSINGLTYRSKQDGKLVNMCSQIKWGHIHTYVAASLSDDDYYKETQRLVAQKMTIFETWDEFFEKHGKQMLLALMEDRLVEHVSGLVFQPHSVLCPDIFRSLDKWIKKDPEGQKIVLACAKYADDFKEMLSDLCK